MDKTSSSSSKTIGIVIVVVIIVVGIWLMVRKPSSGTMTPTSATTSDTTTTQTTTDQNAGPMQPATPASGIQSGGSSNADLDQDSASIDSQMQGLNSDSTAANQTAQ